MQWCNDAAAFNSGTPLEIHFKEMGKRFSIPPRQEAEQMASIADVVDPAELQVKGYDLGEIDYMENEMPAEIGSDPKLMAAIANSLFDKVESGV